MNPTTAQEIAQSKAGKELTSFLAHTIKSLDRVTDITLTDEKEIAIEVLGRKHAANKLKEILEPLLDIRKETEREEPEVY